MWNFGAQDSALLPALRLAASEMAAVRGPWGSREARGSPGKPGETRGSAWCPLKKPAGNRKIHGKFGFRFFLERDYVNM